MDANTFFGLAIGGIVIFVWGYDRVKKLFQHGTPAEASTPAALAEAAAAATVEQPLAARAWLDYVNSQPDSVPHLAVIGPSGAGKSTFTTAVLADRPGQIVVITAKEGDHWGNLPYIGIDDDATYTTANTTFAALDKEVKGRLVAVKQKRLTAEWLTIVLDDYSTLRIVCEAADEPFKLVARIGRSLRVRLVVLSDSASVKAWGIEGEGETRASFAFVRLKRGHTGTLDIEEQPIPIDTTLTPRVAAAAQLAARAWRPARDPQAELADLLEPVPGVFSGDPTGSGTSSGTSSDLVPADTAALEPFIRRLLDLKVSRNQIAAALGGNRSAALTTIRRAVGEE